MHKSEEKPAVVWTFGEPQPVDDNEAKTAGCEVQLENFGPTYTFGTFVQGVPPQINPAHPDGNRKARRRKAKLSRNSQF